VVKVSRFVALIGLFGLAAGLASAQAPHGSGHTTQPVGNYANGSILPSGQVITPTAAPGSTIQILSTGLRPDGNADAAEAVTTALSPDGHTLLVLTSGWNRDNHLTNGTSITFPTLDPTTGAAVGTTTMSEWVFVFSINNDGSVTKQQQINIPSTYSGLAWSPDGARFYISGGQDDRIYIYRNNGTQFVPDAPFILLGHNSNASAPFPNYDGSILKGTKAAETVTFGGTSLIVGGAVVAGFDLSRDGKTLVAANFENDSVSIVDTTSRTVTNEVHFFAPGGTVAQGEFPYDVVVLSNADGSAKTAFVTSQRDDQVMAVDIASGNFAAIAVGDQPNRMALTKDQKTLYVVNGNEDSVSVIDTASQSVTGTISLSRPGDKYKGSNPNSAALSRDEKTLFVTLGFENVVAVVDLEAGNVKGRIPTGWYPTSVSVKKEGRERLYVCTFKSNDGPNPTNGPAPNPTFLQARTWPLSKAQLNIIPVPHGEVLEDLTEQADRNDGVFNRRPDPLMAFLQQKISHVIYIIKENKTYDQVLGDLPRGNGDPSLTEFPQPITPNHHSLALTFGLMDNFYDSGMVSGDGWGWSTYAQTTDYNEKTIAVNYGNGQNGVTYDAEGTTRLIGEGLPDFAANPSQFTVRLTTLLDPTGSSSILPGTKDVNAPFGSANFTPSTAPSAASNGDSDKDGDDSFSAEAVGGHLWDSALRSNKTVRNYGFFIDEAYYVTTQADPTKPDPVLKVYLPISPTPFASNLPQAVAVEPELRDKTDLFYRGFDQNNADIYLFNEWQRDVAINGLPNLTLLRMPHDHFGDFSTAVAGLNTPSLEIADNDYAIGQVVDFISHSPYWSSTAIFILEDDAQDGGDHVDAHRSFVYAISPYSKRGVTISTNYNTVSVLRTIEDLLGIDHLNQSDANAAPMSDVFSGTPNFTPYSAIIPGSLCASPVSPALVPACNNASARITPHMPELRDAAWWAANMRNFDFHREDRLDTDAFNRVLWTGIMGSNVPYPAVRSGLDLRKNRAQLLKKWQTTKKAQMAEARLHAEDAAPAAEPQSAGDKDDRDR
jgi:YVTN family beta-propeller protein